ncbi:MAG: hypothetical protein U0228_29420 [Myxococcaceae bacterium]
MHREFSIIRMKAEAKTWEFPLSWDETTKFSPVAGTFSEFEMHRLHHAIATFPRARPVRDGRRAWTIHGVDVWLTSDGSLYVDGMMDLEFITELFRHLKRSLSDLLVEDRITNVIHDLKSLERLARREEVISMPFDLPPDVAA